MPTHTLHGARRTGPIGRLARLLLAATAGLGLASITDQGGLTAFHDQSLRNEPGLVLIAAIMAVVLVSMVGAVAAQLTDAAAARRWRRATLAALAVAAAIGAATAAEPWRSPLIDLVWTFDALMLAETVIAALLAAALGTPGCEVGVWPELIARAQARSAAPVTGVACLVGLDALDRWETRQRRIGVGGGVARPNTGDQVTTRWHPTAVTRTNREVVTVNVVRGTSTCRLTDMALKLVRRTARE